LGGAFSIRSITALNSGSFRGSDCLPDKIAPADLGYQSPIRLIGHVCIFWSQLENAIAKIIWRMLKIEDETIGKIVTGGLDMRPRINMAVTLARHIGLPNDHIAILEQVRTNVEAFSEERNLVIHGVMMTDEADGKLRLNLETHRGKRRGVPQEITDERIANLGFQIVAEVYRLFPVLKSMGIVNPLYEFPSWLPPSSETTPER
jgi:hypothetical protein